jgi:hypothetical protein
MKDTDIEVLGEDPRKLRRKKRNIQLALGIFAIVLIVIVLFLILRQSKRTSEITSTDETYTPTEGDVGKTVSDSLSVDTIPFTLEEMEINGNKYRCFQLVNAELELALYNDIDTTDTAIVFVTQAANIRGDNNKIIGDFIYKGDSMAKGCPNASTLGFCAIFGGKTIIGKANPTTFLDSAKNDSGFFFRQYALVNDNGFESFESEAKSYRRALCIKDGNVMVVESIDKITLSAFAEALFDYDISNAVNLMGGKNLDEWYVKDGKREVLFINTREPNPNRNYLIFRAK